MIKSLNINTKIKTLGKMRYFTCGDYFIKGKTKHFEIADCGNDVYNTAILIHELFEELKTRKNKISEKKISAFDKKFEEKRAKGIYTDEDCGDDKKAPYYKEHQQATLLERMIIELMGEDWQD